MYEILRQYFKFELLIQKPNNMLKKSNLTIKSKIIKKCKIKSYLLIPNQKYLYPCRNECATLRALPYWKNMQKCKIKIPTV